MSSTVGGDAPDDAPTSRPPSSGDVCVACGAALAPSARFCDECGRRVIPKAPDSAPVHGVSGKTAVPPPTSPPASTVLKQPRSTSVLDGSSVNGKMAALFVGVGVVALGALVGGVILIIFGIIQYSNNSAISNICNSGFGQFSQGLDQQAQQTCSAASVWTYGSIALILIGVAIGLWGLRYIWAPLVALLLVREDRAAQQNKLRATLGEPEDSPGGTPQ